MRIEAVITARLLAFVELASLNPKGHVFFPRIIGPVVERFSFQKYPCKPEDFDESKGVEFLDGHFDGINVSKLTIYHNGFLVDTQSSSDDSEKILLDTLEWARGEFGITFNPNMIYRRRYLSDLVVQTDAPILAAFEPLKRLRASLTGMTEMILGERLTYDVTRLDVDFERYQRNTPIAPLTIQRRADSGFPDNRYFSEAPLPTHVHWELLTQFERDVLANIGP
jgi:hypothetical protein